eukprot:XP_015576035.1 uncharacterized protein LOC107261428 [Ricinus communis]
MAALIHIIKHLSSDGSLFLDPTLYCSLVGALQHLTITRPDITYTGTIHFGLTFRPSAVLSALIAYSDADWAGCPDTRRSTSSYSIFLGNNLVSCSAKKQPTVSRSTCESEYCALALTAAELL